ncbi:MAG: excinuclease ABC subunit UvrB [Candidatus Izemoplasmatales bacterium]|nr:excinuclease ABC subunit UvrB [Candidatus Izemoplasmatales bacterium]MDD4987876.1 excinuclease ABC subunit UvrB [Candidatus Izemoplasmatales bacterium]MDY0373616.1 excinuclease ABC subunit UvrB [Candidatus Izemoplasmatales bacterium]
MNRFELVSDYQPTGDQPRAIAELVQNLNTGMTEQVLLGATGTGKTFTISKVIEACQRPVLVLAHNKTLAGQLYSEFKNFFPNNRVEYFISYYDYYQPEAYVPGADIYIEKDAQINDEIDEMRHAATSSLLERNDVIIVASVSCIYGIGDPEEYRKGMVTLRVGDDSGRDELLEKLVTIFYERNDMDFVRGSYRVKGDIVEILPPYERSQAIRVEFDYDTIKRLRIFNVVTGEISQDTQVLTLFPASHFLTDRHKMEEALQRIEDELKERVAYFKEKNLLLEAERIQQRTLYDLEMLKEVGSCSGIENYSRHLALRKEGETPSVLIDFFPKDFLLVIDESHVTIPQVRGMFNGDRSRKQTLIDYGFRLPSALDNRPLNFSEFLTKINQVIYVSATPGDFETERAGAIVEQIIRPTWLLDPRIEVRRTEGQIDDLLSEIEQTIQRNERVLITTLTIKMSEDLSAYLESIGYKVAYLHSEIKSLERMEVIRNLRLGVFDILVGINLLREGLDLPEVSLIAILDADKEGFLRSERSLIQTIGRAARNANGKVIMYASKVTDSMQKAIDETNRRRRIQETYNQVHQIEPKTIIKPIFDSISIKSDEKDEAVDYSQLSQAEREKNIAILESQMFLSAKELDFERAAELRDILFELKKQRT